MIRLERVTKSYGPKVAVDALDLEIPAGELWGLVGPNGAGKTTTILVAAGQSVPDSGRALIAGHDVHAAPLAARAALGFVPQETSLYRYLTAQEFLDFVGEVRGVPADRRAARIDELLALWELEDARHKLLGQFSVGMAKKVALSAALLAEPPALILDEVFAGLDPRAVIRLKEVLRARRAAGTAVLLAEHVLDVVENLCDAVAILAGGKLRTVLRGESLRAVTAPGGPGLERAFLDAIAAPSPG